MHVIYLSFKEQSCNISVSYFGSQWHAYLILERIFSYAGFPGRLSCGLELQWQVGVAGTLRRLARSLVVAEGQFWWSLSRQDGIVGRVEGGKALKLILRAGNTPDWVVMDQTGWRGPLCCELLVVLKYRRPSRSGRCLLIYVSDCASLFLFFKDTPLTNIRVLPEIFSFMTEGILLCFV